MFFSRKFKDTPNDKMKESQKFNPEGESNEGNWCSIGKATLVTSLTDQRVPWLTVGEGSSYYHAPVFDFDFPCNLIPSTEPGHYHLYMDKHVTWEDYLLVLQAMANAGMVEDGYYRACKARGYAAVRTPWTKKPQDNQ